MKEPVPDSIPIDPTGTKNGPQYRYLNPITGKMVSRQRIWQLRQKQAGRCLFCGRVAVKSGRCIKHYAQSLLRNRANARAKLGCKPNPRAWMENKPDLSGADWSKGDRELARQYHTTVGIIYGYRRRHGKPKNKVGRPKKSATLSLTTA